MLIDAALSIFVLVRTSAQFRFGSSKKVAENTRRAMSAIPMTQTELTATGCDVWRTYRTFLRVRRRWPAPVLCLQTALCLHQILAIKGIPSVVRVGVGRSDAAIGAHAWVEVGEYVLDDAGSSTAFATFAPPPPSLRGAR